MRPFQYYRAESVESAIELFQKNEGAQYIAGSTNLLDLMKKGIAEPKHLVDISRLPLNFVQNTEAGITFGAMCINSELAKNPFITVNYPLIAKALLAGASPQLRNMATVGGNLLQRTRCPYFYDTALPCNKRQPNSGCGMKDGVARSAALFGTSSSCVATHPSDLCVALAALNAEVRVMGTQGHRSIPIADFHLLPGNTPHLENSLKAGEIITEVFVPNNKFAKYNNYWKIRDRASYAFALVSAAICLETNKMGEISQARIALGGVAPKPWRATEAENFMLGQVDSPDTFRKAAQLAVKGAATLPDNEFKVKLLENAIFSSFMTAI